MERRGFGFRASWTLWGLHAASGRRTHISKENLFVGAIVKYAAVSVAADPTERDRCYYVTASGDVYERNLIEGTSIELGGISARKVSAGGPG
jgi:ferric-dicitrate binding protein FerR (iron transport regulator)